MEKWDLCSLLQNNNENIDDISDVAEYQNVTFRKYNACKKISLEL